jgi:hypothetical protein
VLLRLEIACYSAPSRLALDAHCSPKKTQFMTFRGIRSSTVQKHEGQISNFNLPERLQKKLDNLIGTY